MYAISSLPIDSQKPREEHDPREEIDHVRRRRIIIVDATRSGEAPATYHRLVLGGVRSHSGTADGSVCLRRTDKASLTRLTLVGRAGPRKPLLKEALVRFLLFASVALEASEALLNKLLICTRHPETTEPRVHHPSEHARSLTSFCCRTVPQSCEVSLSRRCC